MYVDMNGKVADSGVASVDAVDNIALRLRPWACKTIVELKVLKEAGDDRGVGDSFLHKTYLRDP